MCPSDRCAAGARRRAALAALALTALLAACATVPTPPPAAPAAPDAPREWAGRFSVRVESTGEDGRQDAAAGRFTLLSSPSPAGRSLSLELVSPFGQTLAEGRRAPDGQASLALADGRRLQADSLDRVLEQALGWPLPIERLPDWLDDRFEHVLERAPDGRPSVAQDSGWRIEREPRRWTLARPHPQGRLRVVLLLDR
jgi:outer membrane lipoprotein LolB